MTVSQKSFANDFEHFGIKRFDRWYVKNFKLFDAIGREFLKFSINYLKAPKWSFREQYDLFTSLLRVLINILK